MLSNPYGKRDDVGNVGLNTGIPNTVLQDLHRAAPFRGSIIAIVNSLINNFHADLRQLASNTVIYDYSTVVAILLERRPFTDDQLARLRSTSVGVAAGVIQQERDARTTDRTGEAPPSNTEIPADLQGGGTGGKRRAREKKPTRTEEGNPGEV